MRNIEEKTHQDWLKNTHHTCKKR